MPNRGYPILDGVGVEFEVMALSQGRLSSSRELSALGFNVTRDASVESRIKTTGLFSLMGDSDFPIHNINNQKVGSELVSSVFNTTETDMLQVFKSLTSYLSKEGEPETSERASIHYHISYPFNLRILKSVMRLAANMEDLFFQLGCMGYTHRGEVNDSAYCRPITGKGPIVIPNYEGERVQIFNLEDLLSSNKLADFWQRYGDLANDSIAGNRYVPVRYHWINLKSLLNQNSLEFRVFNTTLNPMFMWATLSFCQAFSAFCISNNNSYSRMKKLGMLKEHSVFNPRSKNKMIRALDEFAELVDLDLYALDVLKDIINFSPNVKLKERYIFSHLRNVPNHWTRGEYLPPVITDKVYQPDFVDIHVLDNQPGAPVEAEAELPRPGRRIPRPINLNDEQRQAMQQEMHEMNLGIGRPADRVEQVQPVFTANFNNNNANEEDEID